MSCDGARELFSALVDGALGSAERRALGAHLAGCADCQRELDRFERTVGMLRAVEPARAPVGFVDRVLGAARGTPWPQRLARGLLFPLRVKLPLEAAAILVVAGAALYVFQHTPELQQASRQEAPAAQGPTTPAPAGPSAPSALPVPAAAPTPTAPPAPEAQRPSRPEARPPVTRDLDKDAAKAPVAPRAGPEVASKARREEEAPSPKPPASEPARAEKKADLGKREPPREQAEAGAGRARSSIAARAPAEPPAPTHAPAGVDVLGRLVVGDREAADRALGELAARLGGSELSRRSEAGLTIVEMVVPRERYGEFVQGLARIGRWAPEREAAEPSAQVRVTLRISD